MNAPPTSACPRCSGFGWVPTQGPSNWYEHDWRLMLDPSVAWEPCPRCRSEHPLARLQRNLARMLIARFEGMATSWSDDHGWRRADLQRDQVLLRWRDIACVGSQSADAGWMLVSDLGIMRGLARERLAYHCAQAGAPPLPT